MRLQSPVYLRALAWLLSMAPVFCEASHNYTNGMATMTEYNMTANESTPFTTTPLTTTSNSTTIITQSSDATNVMTSMKQSPPGSSTWLPSQDSTQAKTVVGLLFFFCLLIALIYCSYKWYTRHGRPSFLEIWRIVSESARNAWAAVMERLRPSSKEEAEEEEEMEAGMKEEVEEGKQPEDVEDDDSSDTSDDYSSMGGAGTMEELKEDGKSKEREDDMTSVELQDEKTERGKDDLTVL